MIPFFVYTLVSVCCIFDFMVLRINYFFNGYIRWYAFLLLVALVYIAYSEVSVLFAFIPLPLLVLTTSKGIEIKEDCYRNYIQILRIKFGKFQNVSEIANIQIQSHRVRVGMNSRGSSSSYFETVYEVFFVNNNEEKKLWFKTNKEKVIQKFKNEFPKLLHLPNFT